MKFHPKLNPSPKMQKILTFDYLLKRDAFVRFALYFAMFAFAGTMFGRDRPNIVVVLADDLGYYSLGAFGQQKIKTPNVDKLAENGMKFTNFYANPLCSPSRGSLHTGMHTGHGMIRWNYELGGYSDDEEFGQMPLPANIQTMGKALKKAGYMTAVMGKWGTGGPDSTGIPNLQGIDHFFGYLDQKQAHNYYPTHLWRNEERVSLPNAYFPSHPKDIEIEDPNDPESYAKYRGEVYSTDVIHEEAMDFIRNHKDEPFYLGMSYTLPHMALQVPERALAQYKGQFDDEPYLGERGYLPNQYPRATYAAMISLLDSYVGDLMNVLKEQGLDKNTLVIFTADNGAAVVGGCDPDYFDCSGSLRGRKGSLYEGGIKVPFVAYWPGVIEPGSESDHISAIWDLMPTFMDLAGNRDTGGLNGLSFLPALTQIGQQEAHEFLYWERHPRKGLHSQAVRFGKWKAVKTTRSGNVTTELFNLEKDLAESNDVLAQYPEVAKRAEGYFQRRRRAAIAEWNINELYDAE